MIDLDEVDPAFPLAKLNTASLDSGPLLRLAVGDDQFGVRDVDVLWQLDGRFLAVVVALLVDGGPRKVENDEELLTDRLVVTNVRVRLVVGLVERDERALRPKSAPLANCDVDQ